MQAGKLTQRIEFQRLIVEKDSYGHEKYSYEPAFSTRADILYNNGDRLIENQEIFYDTTLTFKCRFYCPIEDTMRIKHQNKLYRIISVDNELNTNRQKTVIGELINE